MSDIASIDVQVFFVKILVEDHLILLVIDINEIINNKCVLWASRSSHHFLLELLVLINSLWPAVILISLRAASTLKEAHFLVWSEIGTGIGSIVSNLNLLCPNSTAHHVRQPSSLHLALQSLHLAIPLLLRVMQPGAGCRGLERIVCVANRVWAAF